MKGDTYPITPKFTTKTSAFSMIKLEISIDLSQRLKEIVIVPVGDMIHIQEGILPFMHSGRF